MHISSSDIVKSPKKKEDKKMEKIIKRNCQCCGKRLEYDNKKEICRECKKEKRKEWWKENWKWVAGIGAAITAGIIIVCTNKSNEDIDFDQLLPRKDDEPLLTSDSEIPEFPSGEKYWNPYKQNWEKDGKPYIYRVTWTSREDGEVYTKDYRDIDSGYEFYEDCKTDPDTKNVDWEHIAPEDQ